jgi:hypothetical protein
VKILFLHGWHSVPGGVKPTFLAQHGHEVINPALPDEDVSAGLHIPCRQTFHAEVLDSITDRGQGGTYHQAGPAELVHELTREARRWTR